MNSALDIQPESLNQGTIPICASLPRCVSAVLFESLQMAASDATMQRCNAATPSTLLSLSRTELQPQDFGKRTCSPHRSPVSSGKLLLAEFFGSSSSSFFWLCLIRAELIPFGSNDAELQSTSLPRSLPQAKPNLQKARLVMASLHAT